MKIPHLHLHSGKTALIAAMALTPWALALGQTALTPVPPAPPTALPPPPPPPHAVAPGEPGHPHPGQGPAEMHLVDPKSGKSLSIGPKKKIFTGPGGFGGRGASADTLIRESKIGVLQSAYAESFEESVKIERQLIGIEDPAEREKMEKRLNGLNLFMAKTESQLRELTDTQRKEEEKAIALRGTIRNKIGEVLTTEERGSDTFTPGKILPDNFGEQISEMVRKTVESAMSAAKEATDQAKKSAEEATETRPGGESKPSRDKANRLF